MNQLNAIGRIGRDAEIRYTPAGDAIASFSFALTSGYGEKQVTSWLNCSVWGKRAETLAPMLTKGSQIGITGEFAARKYMDKEGVEKMSLDVRVSDVTLLGRSTESASAPSKPQPKPNEQTGSGFEDFEDDIPFN